jgi:hypothetical protein
MDLILKFNEGGTIPAEICAACRGSRNEKEEEAYGKKEEGKTKGCGHLKNRDPDLDSGIRIRNPDPQLEKMLDPDPH